MGLLSTRERYGSFAQFLHWSTAILAVVAFTFGPGGSEQRVYSAAKDFERQLHETLGLAVFALTLARILWRAFDGTPDAPPMPAWMHRAAKAVHWILYILLLALPLTAISGAWLEGHPLTLLGNVRIGPWLTEVHAVGSKLASVHEWLGDALMWVAGAHAAAALFHHFLLRDRLLRSMLPGSG
jgi:cytochrome b561